MLSKLSRVSMVKIDHFSDEWKVVSVAPQRGMYTPHKSRGVFFRHFATASRLNTLDLKLDMYNPLNTSFKKF